MENKEWDVISREYIEQFGYGLASVKPVYYITKLRQ